MKCAIALLALAAALAAAPATSRHRRATRYHVLATAYSDAGTTKGGTDTHVGTAAADPAVLPLGTKVRLHDAGRYSGTYVIADTGNKVGGHHIDIFLPNKTEAKRFGRKLVWVQVLKWGDGAVTESADRSRGPGH